MNRYLDGTRALAAQGASVADLARVRPLSVTLARRIVTVCIGALEGARMERSWEIERQLSNIASTIDNSGLEVLPDAAADALGKAASTAVACIGEEAAMAEPSTAPEAQENADPPEEEEEPLLLDFGWNQQADIEFDAEGTFSFDDDTDDNYAIDGIGDAYDVLGMFDIGQAQIKMNGLKPVTVGIAKALIRGGMQVMAVANMTAQQHSLPLQTNRDEVVGHLQWHVNKLGTLRDDKAIYASGDDAKKWAMQAFIEANSVEEGAAYLDESWTQMWTEIGQRLAELPKNVVQTIAKLPGQVFEATTGIPSWAFWIGGAALVGLVGYGAYRILAGPAGGAVFSHYLGRR